MLLHTLIIALLIVFSAQADAESRSKAQRSAFVRANPCPETGVTRGACPGWEVDHIEPLCAGGVDRPENMQWLQVDEHKVKTKRDVRFCRIADRREARRPASTDFR